MLDWAALALVKVIMSLLAAELWLRDIEMGRILGELRAPELGTEGQLLVKQAVGIISFCLIPFSSGSEKRIPVQTPPP
uniref:Uncharacterized protein n=1 Tax=Knipowitschia caucasica TaxID=637954 RepID=A0AAV2KQZ4_KNICA